MKTRHLFAPVIVALGLLLVAVLRPAWAPGVIEGGHQQAADLDPVTRDWLRKEMRERGIPGLSLAVVIDGEVAAVDALGVSNYWTRVPVTPDTLLEVASNSKVVTGLAAIRDVHGGALELARPLTGYRKDFSLEGAYADHISLEILLTHTAGLGNALGRETPVADSRPEGRFQYSGLGFELVGELIAHEAGTDLPEALRASVLTPLGVSERATYAQVGDSGELASPHMSIAQPLILLVLPCLALFSLLSAIAWLSGKLGLLKRRPESLGLWLLAISVVAPLALPFLALSTNNAIRYLLTDLVFVALAAVVVVLLRKWARTRSPLPALSAAALVFLLSLCVIWHLPVPLEERKAMFPAAAGLRASARDMGQLLAALLHPPAGWEQDVAVLTTPRVRVNQENHWGLGIGIQEIDGHRRIWHWGINYPGYYSLILGDPASGDGLVVLMNGGPTLITPEGARYSALEMARELSARVLPGPHGAYWHGVQ